MCRAAGNGHGVIRQGLICIYIDNVLEATELSEMKSDVLKHFHIVIKHIKVDKSPGPEQMYAWTLWDSREEIGGIFVSLLVIGKVPEAPRVTNFVLLFKKS